MMCEICFILVYLYWNVYGIGAEVPDFVGRVSVFVLKVSRSQTQLRWVSVIGCGPVFVSHIVPSYCVHKKSSAPCNTQISNKDGSISDVADLP